MGPMPHLQPMLAKWLDPSSNAHINRVLNTSLMQTLMGVECEFSSVYALP